MIEAPEDAVATKNVEPGKTKVIQDVIPHTLTVPEGCKITIPVLKGAKAPKLVAKRLHIIGPVGASMRGVAADRTRQATHLHTFTTVFAVICDLDPDSTASP